MRGFFIFLRRPYLWKMMAIPILVSLITTITSLAVLFGWALKPQQQWLLNRWGWPGWLSWTSAVLIVLAETSLTNLIILCILFGHFQSRMFRAILEERGILSKLRAGRGAHELPEATCCRDLTHAVFFLMLRVPLMLFALVLNAIPVFGQIAWCSVNGWLYTWELEAEFMVMFEDRHTLVEQWRFVRKHFATFATFGACAMALELIPFAGPWIFFASNACGAALLAERILLATPASKDKAS